MAKKYSEPVDPNAPNHGHAFMLDLVGCNRRVLELGAAAGHVTRALVDQGCVVTAIECDGEAAVQLKEVADEVFVGDLNDAAIFDDVRPSFDVVLAGDLLEHLLAPQATTPRECRVGSQAIIRTTWCAGTNQDLPLYQAGQVLVRPNASP